MSQTSLTKHGRDRQLSCPNANHRWNICRWSDQETRLLQKPFQADGREARISWNYPWCNYLGSKNQRYQSIKWAVYTQFCSLYHRQQNIMIKLFSVNTHDLYLNKDHECLQRIVLSWYFVACDKGYKIGCTLLIWYFDTFDSLILDSYIKDSFKKFSLLSRQPEMVFVIIWFLDHFTCICFIGD